MNVDFVLEQMGYFINSSRDLIFVVLYVGTIKANRMDYKKRIAAGLAALILITLFVNLADQYFYGIIFDSLQSKWGHTIIASIRNLITFISFFVYIYILKSLPKRVVFYDALLISSIRMACHNIFLTPATKPVLDVTVKWIDNTVLNWLLCIIILNVTSCAVYYVINRFILLNNIKDVDVFRMILALCLFLISVYLNCTVKTIEFIDNEHSMQLSGYIIILQFLFLLCIGYFEHYKQSVQVQNYILLENQAVYSLLHNIEKDQKNEAMFHQMRHDFRNHLISLRYLVDHGEGKEAIEYIDGLTAEYLSGQPRIRTGNLIIDGILAHKMEIAEKHHITVSVSADFSCLNSMENTDLCIIFGNLLDNALEACMKTAQEARFINLRGHQIGETMIYSMENSFIGEAAMHDGMPVTTKENKRMHGMGLNSVRRSAEKYAGTIAFSMKDGRFSAVCAFPLPISAADSLVD